MFEFSTTGRFITLHCFTTQLDAARPFAGVVRDAAGNLYGTTYAGGSFGLGAVFKVDPSRHETVLHSFAGGADGAILEGGAVVDAAGNIYGTTVEGGLVSKTCSAGCGTVFEIDASGTKTVLHTFAGPPDGALPEASLVRDAGGNLYGTTVFGGTSKACKSPCGTVFELSTGGQERVLFSFAGAPDAEHPAAGLVRDAAGNLYGTTVSGGNGCAHLGGGGCGTVFKLDPSGNETLLHVFDDAGPDGAFPVSPLTEDAAGNLYGTTPYGGVSQIACQYPISGCGTVFKLTP